MSTRPTSAKSQIYRDHAEFNARRPRDSACWYLSPYEFQLRWEIVPTRAPRSWQEWSSKPRQAWDVELTPAGEAKLRANGDKAVRLIPGQDTQLRSDLPKEVLAFEDSPVNSRIRAAWLLRLRRRPRFPTFGHCPIPRYNQDRVETNSKICLVYFRAWTGLPKSADEDVPHVADLLGNHELFGRGCGRYRARKRSSTLATSCRYIACAPWRRTPRTATTTARTPPVPVCRCFTNFRATLRTRAPNKKAPN